MTSKTFRFTMPGGRHVCLDIDQQTDRRTAPRECAVVDTAADQNRLREMVGVLFRYVQKLPWYDLRVTYVKSDREFCLWVVERDWPGRAGYYAGMIHVRTVQRRHRHKKVGVS